MTVTYSYRDYAEQVLHIATYATISAALAQLQQHMKCPDRIEPLSLDTPQQQLDAVALHRIGAQLLTLVRPLPDREPTQVCILAERDT
jgi:hypothetical protein